MGGRTYVEIEKEKNRRRQLFNPSMEKAIVSLKKRSHAIPFTAYRFI